VLTVTFADLRFRYRQFLIAVVGAGVVLAMGILMAGLAGGFRAEINRTVSGVGADRWVMSGKAHGRLTSVATFPAADVAFVGHERGVRRASGELLLPQEVVRVRDKSISVNLMGVADHGLGAPTPTSGHGLTKPGQAVVDPHTGATIGSKIRIGSRSFDVVGLVRDRTLNGGMPITFVSLHDAQSIGVGGEPLVTAVVTKGVPTHAPAGLKIYTNSTVETQTLQTLAGAVSSIDNSRTLMWLVATIIVAALVYVSALQRVRDFAVLKALGSSSSMLFTSLCLQSVIVTLVAAGVGAVACNFMKGVFSQPVVIPSSAFVTLPIVAVAVGLVSSLVALRTATRADPVSAFGG
jgi:putative ABC transport system permease protein